MVLVRSVLDDALDVRDAATWTPPLDAGPLRYARAKPIDDDEREGGTLGDAQGAPSRRAVNAA